MTHAIISSANKDVIIGFDRPFVIIGERINPTGRKLLTEEMKNDNFSRVEADAIAQVEPGAAVVAICNDDSGISTGINVRFKTGRD